MTRDADPQGQTGSKRLRFDPYVLDLGRGSLLLHGNEVVLRPKTFAVLRHLAENSGRLVTKDELFAAVWPNLAVTDDALVQSVGELRRALGEDGPRLIRTIPRRGYRFESTVSVIEPADPAVTDTAASAACRDGAQSSEPAIGAPAAISLATSSIGRRPVLFAALAIVALLAAGVLWVNRGTLRSGDQPTKSAEVGTKVAIAVLPFVNQSNDPTREYFADGVTQDIINALGRFSALTVMSGNAVLPYKGKPASPAEIGNRLGVRYQVEGSVRHTGDSVRVVAQLVGTDGRVLWSAPFNEALADVFALQDKITTEITGALAIRVTQFEQRRGVAKPTERAEAYHHVLRARPACLRPPPATDVHG